MTARRVQLAVIGGGISGLGIAWEGAKAGMSTVLLESGKIARATSDNSLRIIHGGFRYLQQLDLARIKESIIDQKFILEWAPEVVSPLRCLMPLQSRGLKSRFPAWIGAKLYNSLCRRYGKRPEVEVLQRSELDLKSAPTDLFPLGALHWTDAICADPQMLAQKVRRAAEDSGAQIMEQNSCLKVSRQKFGFVLTTENSEIHAERVVNAAGPWLRSIPLEGIRPLIQPRAWCKAFNVIFENRLLGDYGVGSEDPEGRLLFVVPRAGGTALGTEYLDFSGDPREVTVEDEERTRFIERASKAFPSLGLLTLPAKTESGVLPLKRKEGSKFILYGSEEVACLDGYIEVLSTKYTTFRSQAKKVIEACR